jgi:hypothetical protein
MCTTLPGLCKYLKYARIVTGFMGGQPMKKGQGKDLEGVVVVKFPPRREAEIEATRLRALRLFQQELEIESAEAGLEYPPTYLEEEGWD